VRVAGGQCGNWRCGRPGLSRDLSPCVSRPATGIEAAIFRRALGKSLDWRLHTGRSMHRACRAVTRIAYSTTLRNPTIPALKGPGTGRARLWPAEAGSEPRRPPALETGGGNPHFGVGHYEAKLPRSSRRDHLFSESSVRLNGLPGVFDTNVKQRILARDEKWVAAGLCARLLSPIRT